MGILLPINSLIVYICPEVNFYKVACLMHCQCCLSARAQHTNCRIKHILLKTKNQIKPHVEENFFPPTSGNMHLCLFTHPNSATTSAHLPPPTLFSSQTKWRAVFLLHNIFRYSIIKVFHSHISINSFIYRDNWSTCWLVVISTVLMAEESSLPVCHCKSYCPDDW